VGKFLACDFGAESGRVILGTLQDSKIKIKEIHRFPNRPIVESGHIHWDVGYLFQELKNGLASAAGHTDLLSIGIDTWGVDFGLIGRDGELLDHPFAYRDSRTDGMMEKAFERMPREKIYSYTGTQFMQLNSIYQLLSMVESKSPLLEEAETLLFMPDLFGFLLSGETSTSQLLNAKTRDWEPAIFSALELRLEIMAPLQEPATLAGPLLPEIAGETGLDSVDVVIPASHDTASAVAAVPARTPNWAYLSSGTWSLIGIEIDEPVINAESLAHNFTNEGGYGGTIRFLRNTMGLWLVQKCLDAWKQQGEALSYEALPHLAEEALPFKCIVDPDDSLFLNPPDMPAAILEFCKRTDQPYPATEGEMLRCIFESLALKYRFIIEKIDALRKKSVETLHIVGGGSRNRLLNQWTANATGLPIIAGPTEATAVGNILVQAIAKGELEGIEEGRRWVARSFSLEPFEPEDQDHWNEAYEGNKSIMGADR
jgi:rhamnulokinase